MSLINRSFIVPAVLVSTLLVGWAFGQPEEAITDEAPADVAVVRLLVPPGEVLAGKVEIEALTISPEIEKLAFRVDGEEAGRRNHPPWKTKVSLAKPAREQILEVVALGRNGVEIGRDRIVVNRKPIPFRVRVAAEPLADGTLQARGDVSLPRGAVLERVEIYRNRELIETQTGPNVDFEASVEGTKPSDFIRAVAILEDGRQVEDVLLLNAPGITEELDVNLVQLQVLVTTKRGAPVTDLKAENFEVVQGGEPQEITTFRPAADVPLVLGVVVDSSGSMAPIWPQTLATSKDFFAATMTRKDRAFLIDFDETLRLARPLTSDRLLLEETLDAVRPRGGTALFDAVAFSLLQFESEPGRRALIVLTDGFDSTSTIQDKTITELAGKLGVPIYVVALPSNAATRTNMSASAQIHALKLLTDPTGGRLLRVGTEGVGRAFAQINGELRHQYVIGYYTDVLPDDKKEKIVVRIKGYDQLEVRSVMAWDQLS